MNMVIYIAIGYLALISVCFFLTKLYVSVNLRGVQKWEMKLLIALTYIPGLNIVGFGVLFIITIIEVSSLLVKKMESMNQKVKKQKGKSFFSVLYNFEEKNENGNVTYYKKRKKDM